MRSVAKRRLKIPPTTRWERLLLAALVLILPLEFDLPHPRGISTLFFVFALLGSYALCFRPVSLLLTVLHPVFLTSYVLLFAGMMMELVHPLSNYEFVVRIGLMFGGAVLVATLCRDRAAVKTALTALVVASCYLTAIFFISKYTVLSMRTARTFHEADLVRGSTYATQPLEGNLNGLSAFMVQGAVIALASGMAGLRGLKRWATLVLAMFCLVGACLPMSRGAVIMAIAAMGCLVLVQRGRRVKAVGWVAVVVAVVILLAPQALWRRLGVAWQAHGSEAPETRTRIFLAAVDNFSDYFATGVGSGNYWADWGHRIGFSRFGHVAGPHNSFIAVTIYWGLIGLIPLLVLVWRAARCFPRACGRDVVSLALVGVMVPLLVQLFLSHSLHDKSFCIGLGLLVASQLWIWPRGVVLQRMTALPPKVHNQQGWRGQETNQAIQGR